MPLELQYFHISPLAMKPNEVGLRRTLAKITKTELICLNLSPHQIFIHPDSSSPDRILPHRITLQPIGPLLPEYVPDSTAGEYLQLASAHPYLFEEEITDFRSFEKRLLWMKSQHSQPPKCPFLHRKFPIQRSSLCRLQTSRLPLSLT